MKDSPRFFMRKIKNRIANARFPWRRYWLTCRWKAHWTYHPWVYRLPKWATERLPGLHWCYEFDGLCIDAGDMEFNCCSCYNESAKKILKAEFTELVKKTQCQR